ncbi:MAG: glycosyltransferase family 4 protein [cyanobacterium endosymbiont of Rhopalodia musculus]|uniref:glycosyltransferase family 4 protein n=1 Tax=cyanobacterium endosymbiont of Epithemia clementina EcSB TaxID=3034674 RepID=UPI00247FDFA7|nr:glycosyltransferase family 1 protein [cyanobacterium endosymbiont of Epithemia clementina EcSB]WGT68234.1 glycosyltransferase family 1 protein [cyanobacterium endosymbiont of Epithemia clementina EcSB]
MLKVCLDGTPLRGKLSGIGVYTLNIIASLAKLQETEYFELEIYFHPSVKNWFLRNFSIPHFLTYYPQVSILPIPVTIADVLAKYPNPILSHFEGYLNKPNIIHGTDHYVYPYRKSRKIMTIHDLTFLKYPQYSTTIVQGYLERIKRCLTWTDLIITFSKSTKQDIIECFNINPERVQITYEASRYSSNEIELDKIELLKKSIDYDFSIPYLLFVSTIEPRKNVIALIKAFDYLKEQHKIPHNLILIGKKGWKYQSSFKAIKNSKYQQSIYYLNYLSDELLAFFYAQTEAFIYPSFYEGFGLPVLEAMTLGSPVITSNTSSLPEIAGDAALLINPNDFLELAEAILKVISDSQLRKELTKKGKERAKSFSWERTAQETFKAYQFIN